MPDTTHWIAVHVQGKPEEIADADLPAYLAKYGECVHLVPGRVWRDYLETHARMTTLWHEMRTFKRAAFVPRAVKEGYPIPFDEFGIAVPQDKTQPPKP